MEYKKASGTSGIEGQFYETKLLALILFRLQHDDRIEDFYLATNMNDMGSLDDICLVIKITGRERPVALFIQLKHKEKDQTYLTLDNKTKTKYIDSFLKIKQIISRKDCDKAFCKNITESDCIFILYTNSEFKSVNSIFAFKYSYASLVHDLIATTDTVGYQLCNSENDFGKNILKLLALRFVKFLSDKGNSSMNILNDEYIQQYHVILKQKVVDVTDIEVDPHIPDSKWRTITFKDEFFCTNDKHIVVFRENLFKEILKKLRNSTNAHALSSEQSIDELISSFIADPTATKLTPLIGTHIASNGEGKLKFVIKKSPDVKKQLELINVPKQTIDEAMCTANTVAEEYLRSLRLRVPTTFGNVDLVIRGGRFDHLVTAIVNLLLKYKKVDTLKIITIDMNIENGLLSLNGGLAGAVGNVLIYDETTNMFKFSNNSTTLPNNARSLLERLNKRIRLVKDITDLQEYRFDVKTDKFPKFQFDCADTVRDFLDKFVIYAKQSNQSQVQDILTQNIEHLLSKDHKNSLNSHSVFLHYHEEILRWWMTPRTGLTKCLSKGDDLYKLAINNMKAEPQLSDLDTSFYMNNLRYFEHSFSELAKDEMKLPKVLSKVFIVTETVALTTVKMIQCLKNRYSIDKYVVLDLECIYNLSTTSFCALEIELRKTEKVVFLVGHNNHCNNESSIRLHELVQATKEKQTVVITNNKNKKKVKDYFLCSNDIFLCVTESLSMIESHKKIINNAKTIFQGREIALNLILDNDSIIFVKSTVLDKVIRNETINIGTPLTNPRYDDIKDLYIDRKLSPVRKSRFETYPRVKFVRTFHDIDGEVVLVTADPGIGKSTLLTHLSINTKELGIKLWIVRVNFIDHSKQFHKWQDDDTVIDVLESLKFLCQVIVKDKNVSLDVGIRNDEAYLVQSAGNELSIFELNMFLHFYNRYRLIFVFDGFDEICPYYKDKVVDFLSIAKTSLRKNKMWVTSRPYSGILPDLRRILGETFTIERLDLSEQQSYLNKFWKGKLNLEELNDRQLDDLRTFVDNMLEVIFKALNWIQVVFHSFYDHVRPVLHQSQLKRLRSVTNDGIEALSGIPLLLYFTADYFLNMINIDKTHSKYTLEINLHTIYTMFIENKIKKVLLEDKNKMDLSNAITRGIYGKEFIDCMIVHKKVAAHHILKPLFELLNFEEFQGMEAVNDEENNSLLSKIKIGKDKTGLISYITDNEVPVFLHRTFTEYFAAEHVCEILISNKFNVHQKTLWFHAIKELNKPVFEWIDIKKELGVELADILNEIQANKVYQLNFLSTLRIWNPTALSNSQYIRILSSLESDYDRGCFLEFLIRRTAPRALSSDYDAMLESYNNLYTFLISKMKPHLKKYFFQVSN